jgi:hypothetical protein
LNAAAHCCRLHAAGNHSVLLQLACLCCAVHGGAE